MHQSSGEGVARTDSVFYFDLKAGMFVDTRRITKQASIRPMRDTDQLQIEFAKKDFADRGFVQKISSHSKQMFQHSQFLGVDLENVGRP